MSDIEIIQLPPEQWQRYREIRLETLREEPQAFGSTYADMTQRPPEYWQGRLTDSQRGEKSRLLFAQIGERLVGMIGVFYPEPDVAEIVSVYASKAVRGRGSGKMLMEGILAEIGQREGIRKVVLGVNKQQAAAVGLYRRFGFEVVEEREEVREDGEIRRGYWMEKRLG